MIQYYINLSYRNIAGPTKKQEISNLSWPAITSVC